MRYRLIAAGATAAVAAAALAACGGGATGSGGGGGGGSNSLNVVLETQPWTTALTPYIPQFEKQTGIKVSVQSYSEEQSRNKILVTLQSKSPGLDAYMSLPSLEGKQYSKAGYYQPLDSYAAKAPASWNVKDFNPAPLSGEKVGGKLIGIPINVEGPVIFYRTDLFAKYGISKPTTLDELVAAAKTIKEKSGGKIYGIAGRGLSPSVTYTLGPFFHNQGLSWLDSAGKPNFDKPGAVKAIDTYATLIGKYGPPGVVNNNFTQSSALFGQGRAGMELDSTNELSSIDDPNSSQVAKNIGVLNIPPGPGGSHPTVLQWGLSMSPFSAHKDQAWKFIQWATSPQMQLKLALKGIASPRKSTASDASYKKTLDTPTRRQWSAALTTILATGTGEVGPPAVQEAEVRKLIGDSVDKVILGQSTAAQAAAAIQKGLPALIGSK